MSDLVAIPSTSSRRGFAALDSSEVPKLDQLLAAGVFLVLIFGILAFGAVEHWSMFAQRMGAAVLFAVWAAAATVNAGRRIVTHLALIPIGLFIVLVLAQVYLHLSAYRYATAQELLNLVTYALLFFVAAQVLSYRSVRATAGLLFAWFAPLFAFYAVVQHLTSPDKLYWTRVPRFGGWVFGSYVNHNHYAGAMEMLAPFAFVRVFSRGMSHAERGFWLVSSVLAYGSVFLAQSRAGMLAVFVQFCVFGGMLWRRRRSFRLLALAVALIVAGALFVYWIGGADTFSRMASIRDARLDAVAGGRWTILHDGFRMFRERPILGWGLGVFPIAYPHFRSFYTDAFINQAHNDYLQALVETGAIGAGLLLVTLLFLFWNTGERVRRWMESRSSAATLAATIGIVGLLVHSWADFNLHIPANAALFAVLCAFQVRPARSTGRNHVARQIPRIRTIVPANGG